MIKNSLKEYVLNLPLFFGGLFLVYLGIVDQTLFYAILDKTSFDRFGVTLTTVVSAGIPIFFAVGLIKKGIFLRWETIHFYEKLIDSKILWILTSIFLGILSYFIFKSGLTITNMVHISGSVLLIAYLILYMKRKPSP